MSRRRTRITSIRRTSRKGATGATSSGKGSTARPAVGHNRRNQSGHERDLGDVLCSKRCRETDGRPLVRRHALAAEFLDRTLILRKMRHSHTTQHVWRFGELDVVVTDDLYAVAQGSRKSRN